MKKTHTAGRVDDVPEHDADRDGEEQQEPPGSFRRRARCLGRRGGDDAGPSGGGAARLCASDGVRGVPRRGRSGGSDAVPVPLPRTLRTRSGAIPASLRILAMGPRGSMQRGQQQMLGRRGPPPLSRASFEAASMQSLRVGGVGQLLRPPRARPRRPPASSRWRAATLGVESEPGQHRLRRSARLEQRQHDVLGADGVVTQAAGPAPARPRARAGPLALSALWVDDGAGRAPDSERLGFVDEHDGDAVLDGVDEAAGVADQGFGLTRGTRGHPCTWGRPGSAAARGPGSWGLRLRESRSGSAPRRSCASGAAP